MKLYDDTLIILTADHGEAFYEHGYWDMHDRGRLTDRGSMRRSYISL